MSSRCLFFRSKAPAWSLQAQLCAGEGAPSLFPVPTERGQGLPHPQLRKWHRPPTSHSEETPGRPKGEAAKQRAPEPPAFTHLSLARASMKIWCIFKGDTAIKWRELLVVDEPSPWPVSPIILLGKLLVKRTKDEDDLKVWDWEVIAGQDLVVRIGSRQPGSHWGATVHFWSGRAILAHRGG
jgi:hypothetical protein